MNLLLFISDIYERFNISETTQTLISLCIMLLAGFLVTRLTKLCKLPNVTGFILAGILIGPYVLKIIPLNLVSNMSFVSDIALTFIAFGVGKFFTMQVIKIAGKKVILITLIESLFTGMIMLCMLKFVLNLSWTFSFILSALATATAPASTMMTINQYKAKGDFVNTLLQVIAFDNVICLFIFSIVSSVVSAMSLGTITALDIALPIIYNVGSILVGFIFGIILGKLLAIPTRSTDNRLILLVALLLAMASMCAIVNISPLLGCMVFGATYINYTKDKKLYNELNSFTPPIMSIFFILSGMSLNLLSLKTAGIIGLTYVLIRVVGKYIGSYLGATLTHEPNNIKKYLGLGLIPQAGVAIGLAFLAQRILPIDVGSTLLTIILASSVLFEIIGPASAKASLFLSGSIPKKQRIINHDVKDSSVSPLENIDVQTETTEQNKTSNINVDENSDITN